MCFTPEGVNNSRLNYQKTHQAFENLFDKIPSYTNIRSLTESNVCAIIRSRIRTHVQVQRSKNPAFAVRKISSFGGFNDGNTGKTNNRKAC